MKPFFKAVLIINHTDNKDCLGYGELQALAQEKHLTKDQAEFDEIIARLDELCVYLLKSNPQTPEDLSEILKRFGFEDEKTVKELSTIWEHEKEQAFSHLIKKAGNYRKLDKIEWSLNNKFYTKKAKNLNEMTAVFALKISQCDNSNVKHLAFELNNAELAKLYTDLNTIEQEISDMSATPQAE